ncbi:MAG: flavodoxin family protein [Planctomycetaceae bacterium]|nr:flavodoxin family protein [Planctomycetaceae bacterium]
MKVLAINGSPRADGNTATALQIVLRELEKEGIATECVAIGQKAIRGCLACYQCRERQASRCAIDGDEVNALIPKMIEADGILLGSPVYYSGINGTMKSFLDRAFFAAGSQMRHKVGAAVLAVRRSGGSAAFDQLNKYLLISQMLVVGSNYWNIIHGMAPGEASQDAEGQQVMQTLGRNMAWLLQLIEHGKTAVASPAPEEKIMTNFVR